MSNIPEPVKRQVRQQAGFGCCKCGVPIIQYHHIVKDSQNPEDIMLLCPICHTEATVGAMLKEEQRFFKNNAYNIKRGFVEGQLKVNQKVPIVNIGSTLFIGEGNLISVDGESLISLQVDDGRLEISLKLFDRDDNIVAEIQQNEWISGDPLPWDLEAKFQLLKIRRKLGDISLEFDARKMPIKINADIWRKRQNYQISSSGIAFNGVKKEIEIIGGCLVGIYLNADTLKQEFSLNPFPRFGTGHIISGSNVNEMMAKGLSAWKKLSCKHEYALILNRKKYSVSKCSKCGRVEKTWK